MSHNHVPDLSPLSQNHASIHKIDRVDFFTKLNQRGHTPIYKNTFHTHSITQNIWFTFPNIFEYSIMFYTSTTRWDATSHLNHMPDLSPVPRIFFHVRVVYSMLSCSLVLSERPSILWHNKRFSYVEYLISVRTRTVSLSRSP